MPTARPPAEYGVRAGHGCTGLSWARHRLSCCDLDRESGMMAGCVVASGLSRRHQRLLRVAVAADERPGQDTEILALRHQLAVLQRQLGSNSARFAPGD